MMNVKYKVWAKISNGVTSYLVVNIEDKQVQSSWLTFIDARDQVSILNKRPSSNYLLRMMKCEL